MVQQAQDESENLRIRQADANSVVKVLNLKIAELEDVSKISLFLLQCPLMGASDLPTQSILYKCLILNTPISHQNTHRN